MELRLDMCQKLIPYIYKTVTLETASHGSLVGNPVQTDIMRSVLTVLLPNGQMDIPLDDILSISCFGMETLRFDNAASAQPAAPAVPTTPAPVPSSPVAPAAPPVAEEPVAAPEPVNPLELAPKKEPQKQLTELLIDGDLSAALALATEPEALQHQGYTEEETAQITAQLRADKLPNGHTPEAIAQRLWRVVGNHAGLAKQYARKALPGTLSYCVISPPTSPTGRSAWPRRSRPARGPDPQSGQPRCRPFHRCTAPFLRRLHPVQPPRRTYPGTGSR